MPTGRSQLTAAVHLVGFAPQRVLQKFSTRRLNEFFGRKAKTSPQEYFNFSKLRTQEKFGRTKVFESQAEARECFLRPPTRKEKTPFGVFSINLVGCRSGQVSNLFGERLIVCATPIQMIVSHAVWVEIALLNLKIHKFEVESL